MIPFNLERVTSIKPIYSASALHKRFGLKHSACRSQKFAVYTEILHPSGIPLYVLCKVGTSRHSLPTANQLLSALYCSFFLLPVTAQVTWSQIRGPDTGGHVSALCLPHFRSICQCVLRSKDLWESWNRVTCKPSTMIIVLTAFTATGKPGL